MSVRERAREKEKERERESACFCVCVRECVSPTYLAEETLKLGVHEAPSY
jgi:hypothetical protein